VQSAKSADYFLLTMGSELQSIAAAGTLFFLGLVSPGPNFLVVIESTLRGGQRSGIFTGLGGEFCLGGSGGTALPANGTTGGPGRTALPRSPA
jgi:hypothetical protein